MNSPNRSGSNSDVLAVEVVSDLICPWCYIGKRRLERAAQLLVPRRLQVVWKPFQLNPDMPVEGMNRREYRSRKFGNWERSQALDAEVMAAGRSVGLAFHYDKIERTPNTLAGHKLLWLAEQRGVQDAVAESLFSAYFVEGRDVGESQVLTEIGVAAGLAATDIAQALTDDTTAAAVAQEEAKARLAGIRGVPSFLVHGKVLGSGAQPPQMLATVLGDAFPQADAPGCSDAGCAIS